MHEGSSPDLSFQSGGWLGRNAIRHWRETRVRGMEIHQAECRCGRCRSCLRRIRARPRRGAMKPSARKLASRGRAFPWSRSDKQAFPCPPKRPRRGRKRCLASATPESAAKDERQCARTCVEAALSRDLERQSKRGVLSMRSATACFEPVETRNAVKNGSPVLRRCRSYRTETCPDSRA